MVKFKVAVLSHPFAFVVLNVYVPLEVYVLPFQLKGEHATTESTELVGWLIVKFKVAVLSHPFAFVVE